MGVREEKSSDDDLKVYISTPNPSSELFCNQHGSKDTDGRHF
jgi:hypothetical protein